MIFPKLFRSHPKKNDNVLKMAIIKRNLMRREAKIGGELFGQVAPGGRREFFCLDKNTWIWHEEWLEAGGERKVRTTRYDVRSNTILKSQGGKNYQKIGKAEAQQLADAAKAYRDRVVAEIYS